MSEETKEKNNRPSVRLIMALPMVHEGKAAGKEVIITREIPGPYMKQYTAVLNPEVPIIGVDAVEGSKVHITVRAIDNQGNCTHILNRSIVANDQQSLRLMGTIDHIRTEPRQPPEVTDDGKPVAGVTPSYGDDPVEDDSQPAADDETPVNKESAANKQNATSAGNAPAGPEHILN